MDIKFIVALFSLSTGLIAAVVGIILKLRAIHKAGRMEKNDRMPIIMLACFGLLMVVNMIVAILAWPR